MPVSTLTTSVKRPTRRSGSECRTRGASSKGSARSSRSPVQVASSSARGGAQQRQHDALDQQLADEPPAAGAQAEADGDLLLPRGGAGHQQVGDVRAGDQQHQADHAHQHHQRASSPARAGRTRPAAPGSSASAWPGTARGRSAGSARGSSRPRAAPARRRR